MAAPFLGSIAANRTAKAQASKPQPRIIAMFTHYGCITTKLFPKKAHGQLTSADLEATTLKPLAPFADKILIPRGIRAMNEWTASLARGQGNDPHTQVVGTYFTCQPVTPNTDNPFDFTNATKFQAKPMGPSLDHVMAQQLSSDGLPLFMRVGNASDSPQSGISYSAATTAYPGVGVPSQAFSGITGLFGSGMQNMNPDTYAAVRGKSVIDLVRDDLDSLERFDMSASDKMKLDAWKELLDSTGGAVASASCSQDLANMLGATTDNVNAAGKSSLGSDILTSKIGSTMLDGADIYSSIAVLAAICNANPVIWLKYPGSYVFKGLGLTTEAHSLSHRIGNAGMTGSCVAGVVDMLITIDSYYTQKFAHIVDLLHQVPEGDGTALDNTAAVWFNEMSDGNAHNLNNLPIIQAGSAGGYFKTGWSINVDTSNPGDANLSQGMSESACVDGTPSTVDGTKQSTGTDPKVANAPINKYFVNLMNALGVKAGADGFPAKGGTAEVTSFGRYDTTTDFIHGDKNPPKISNPGGFTELKA